jgi:shikimate dehydrogenase
MTDAHTKVYCIIGNPVRHSMSPHIHNASFAEVGVNAVYVAFEVDDPEGAVRGMRALGMSGASVTIPHKLAVMPLLDEIDDVALMIGAVNTIVNDGGKLFGLNTDGPAAVRALKDAGVYPAGKKIAMIGSGGAARAVSFTLAANENIATLAVLGVVPEEMKKLARELSEKTGVSVPAIDLEKKTKEAKNAVAAADIVVNASPVGMHPDEGKTPIPAEWIRPDAAVFDVVYTPPDTRLLREAAALGCRTVQGVEMFINQAALQFERWTGKPAPVDLMRRIVLEKLGAT